MGKVCIFNDKLTKILEGKRLKFYQKISDPSRYGCILYAEDLDSNVIEKVFDITINEKCQITLSCFVQKQNGFRERITEMQDSGTKIWKEIGDDQWLDTFERYAIFNQIAIQLENHKNNEKSNF